ncbi:MAG: alanine racemase [Myxococcota bacterium]
MHPGVDTPALVVDLEVVERNLARMQRQADQLGVALRPHTKTHKIPELARMQLQAGAAGITVAKLGEAEVMADAGIDDIFIAYPVVGEQKVRRLLALARRVRVSFAPDSLESARVVSDAAHAQGLVIPALLEVDTGLRRCGVPWGEPAAELAQRLAALPGITLRGISTHEGHGYQAGEPDEVSAAAREAGRQMVDTAARIRARGVDISVVSVGATPTAAHTGRVSGITEMRPGTYVFNDRSQLRHGTASLADCAAVVVTTVVSVPAPGRAVVDAGSKALSSDGVLHRGAEGGHGLVLGARGWILARLSEEHGVLTAGPDAEPLHVGQRLGLVPNHICPCVNLFDEVTCVRGDQRVGTWRVAARGCMR